MDIKGIGVDIVEINRIKKAALRWKGSFLKKIFTDSEIRYADKKSSAYQHLAARFAAKEAVLKALSNGWSKSLDLKEIEVWNDSFGKPHVRLRGDIARLGRKRGVTDIVISMSHTAEYAVAYVILVK